MRPFARSSRLAAIVTGAAFCASLAPASAADPTLRQRIIGAFAKVKNYKLVVLGSVRSTGSFVAPNKYHMTTEIEGKPLETVIIGKAYWTKNDGAWQRSGTTSNNLDVDIAGIVRAAKAASPDAFTKLAQTTQDGRKVGTFGFAFADGTDERCNYDLKTYLVTRCKSDQVTLLYSDYNDPKNTVPKV